LPLLLLLLLLLRVRGAGHTLLTS